MTTRTSSDQASYAGSESVRSGESTSLTDAASNVAGEAGRTVEQTAAEGMSQVSEVLHQVADAARQAGEGLQSEQPQIGRMITTGVEKIDEAASYVAAHRPRELMDGAQSFARSQPALVIGGGLLAGLVLGRVLRSAGSQQWDSRTNGQDWYQSGYRGGPGYRSGASSLASSGVSSGYGTGYGTTYDRSASDGGSLPNPVEPAEG